MMCTREQDQWLHGGSGRQGPADDRVHTKTSTHYGGCRPHQYCFTLWPEFCTPSHIHCQFLFTQPEQVGATGFPVGVAVLVEESRAGCIRSRQRVGGVVASGGRTNDAQAAACCWASVGLTHHDPPDLSEIFALSLPLGFRTFVLFTFLDHSHVKICHVLRISQCGG